MINKNLDMINVTYISIFSINSMRMFSIISIIKLDTTRCVTLVTIFYVERTFVVVSQTGEKRSYLKTF